MVYTVTHNILNRPIVISAFANWIFLVTSKYKHSHYFTYRQYSLQVQTFEWAHYSAPFCETKVKSQSVSSKPS